MAQNDIELSVIESDLSISNSMKGTLIKSISEADKKTTVKMIYYLTSRLNDSFNMGSKLNESQITTLSFDLLDVFGYETIEDVVMMYKMARQGLLDDGKIFRLDSHVILGKWIPTYLEKKADQREKESKEISTFDIIGKSDNEWSDESKAQIKKLRSEILETSNKMKGAKLVKKIKHSDIMDELIYACKNYSNKEIEKWIVMWGQRKSHKDYVDILKNELESRK